jgi:hypothetical protein
MRGNVGSELKITEELPEHRHPSWTVRWGTDFSYVRSVKFGVGGVICLTASIILTNIAPLCHHRYPQILKICKSDYNYSTLYIYHDMSFSYSGVDFKWVSTKKFHY